MLRTALLLLICMNALVAQDIVYPETRRSDHTDVYHGMKVADPYRWLEDDVRESDEVKAWVEAQNKTTFGYLETLPQREAIRKRIEQLWDYEKVGVYIKEGGKYYYFKNDGLQNQYVLYSQEPFHGEPEILFDPNTWSEDGTVALGSLAFSEDGRYMAYAENAAGSDWQTWKVLDVATRKPLDDKLEWVKFSGAAWTRDCKGFFYSRYAAPKRARRSRRLNLNQKLYYHRVGTPQSDDVLVYERPGPPGLGLLAPRSATTAAGWSSPSGRAPTTSTGSPTRTSSEPYVVPGRADRQLRPGVHVPRLRRPRLLLPDGPRGADAAHHRHRHPRT